MPSIASGLTSAGAMTGVKPGGDGAADRQLGERELQQRAGAGEEVEAGAGDLGAALHVDRAERLADLEVVAHREVVGGHLADGAQRHRVVLTAGRHLVGDDVGDLQVRVAQRGVGGALGLLGLLHLGGQRLGPLEDGGALLRARRLDRLGRRLLLRRAGRRRGLTASRRAASAASSASTRDSSAPRARWLARTRSGFSRTSRRSITSRS